MKLSSYGIAPVVLVNVDKLICIFKTDVSLYLESINDVSCLMERTYKIEVQDFYDRLRNESFIVLN